MTNTENYGMNKPDVTDIFNIEDLNENMDIIDIKMKEIEEQVSEKAAKSLGYDNTDSGLEASNVQDAIDEACESVKENAINIEKHITDNDNPHKVTKSQMELGNVDNTADIDKPVSTQQQKAIRMLTLEMKKYSKWCKMNMKN